ncbi:MAG: hypothetical protein HYZ53_28210 [Planctomycetes bacterium]|nr:hypothetical protein [Planctomycetota bacterium]
MDTITKPVPEGCTTRLELTAPAALQLREILDGYFVELRREIARTHSRDFREALHQKEATVRELLQQLGGAPS